MVFVVNFTDSDGTMKNRVIPVDDRSVVWNYFKEDRMYAGSKVHKIWSAEQFGEAMERYVSCCSNPQKLDGVGFYGNK